MHILYQTICDSQHNYSLVAGRSRAMSKGADVLSFAACSYLSIWRTAQS